MESLTPLNYCLFFLLLYSSIFAQNTVINSSNQSQLYFERFSTEDGMPSTSVVGITQDQEGFI